MYNRKSLEDKERQVLSIESQRHDNERVCGSDTQLVRVFVEEMSAKRVGRPQFNEMVRRLRVGEADGIIAWHPDRLARNPIDAATIMNLLDEGVIKDLKFATYPFDNSPQGKFMLGILLVSAKYESDYLSTKVERGMRDRAKLDNWLPNRPATGYRNAVGEVRIEPDRLRFSLLRRACELVLTGSHSPRHVWQLATSEWGLTSRDGRPMTLSTFYKILGNPFYAGVITWKGVTYPGKHEPLLTPDEFERIQRLLGRAGRPRPQTREFAYTGLLRCGECGLSVTAEVKTKPSGRQYVYYHCTRRRRDYLCRQPVIAAQDLEAQMLSFLESLRLAPEVEAWVAERLARVLRDDARARDDAQRAAAETLRSVERQVNNLTDLRLRDLVTDEEFLVRKAELDRRRIGLSRGSVLDSPRESWFEPGLTVNSFRFHAATAFRLGGTAERKFVMEIAGSNPTLSARKLSVHAARPFEGLLKNDVSGRGWSYGEDVRTFCLDPDNQPIIARMRQILERLGVDVRKGSQGTQGSLGRMDLHEN